MIVRILGEGQYEVPESALRDLNRLDDALTAAVDAGQEAPFRTALEALIGQVRTHGTALSDDALLPSEAILPSADISLDEVQKVLSPEGLIPG